MDGKRLRLKSHSYPDLRRLPPAVSEYAPGNELCPDKEQQVISTSETAASSTKSTDMARDRDTMAPRGDHVLQTPFVESDGGSITSGWCTETVSSDDVDLVSDTSYAHPDGARWFQKPSPPVCLSQKRASVQAWVQEQISWALYCERCWRVRELRISRMYEDVSEPQPDQERVPATLKLWRTRIGLSKARRPVKPRIGRRLVRYFIVNYPATYHSPPSSCSGWDSTFEYTEGIMPVDHKALHGTPLEGRKKHIRLIQIISRFENKSGDETVHCRMFKTYLDDQDPQPPLFNALSYAWGNPDDNTNIVINGVITSVRSNLESALRHLRDYHIEETGGLLLWVDALCINQDDDEERNEQVQMMGDIYRRAHRVLAWLGEGSADTDWVLPRFRYGTLRRQIADIVDQGMMFIPPVDILRAAATAFKDLCCRAWWGRLWVVQELLLAKQDPILVVGRESVAWSVYIPIFEDLLRIYSRFQLDAESKAVVQMLFVENHQGLSFLTNNKENRIPGLFAKDWDRLREDIHLQDSIPICTLYTRASLLLRKHATEKSDYIYALRSLLPEEEQRLIDVDYSKPPMCVFHDAMAVMWTSPLSDRRRIASLPLEFNFLRGNTTDDFPSWVPDLSAQKSFNLSGAFLTFRTQWKKPKTRISPDKRILTMRGIYFDKIIEVYSVRFEYGFPGPLGGLIPNMDDLRQVIRRCLATLDNDPTTPAPSVPHPLTVLQRGKSRESRVLQTLLQYEHLPREEKYSWLWSKLCYSMLNIKPQDDESFVPSLLRLAEAEMSGRNLELPPFYCVKKFLDALRLHLHFHTIFRTEAGFFGVGPAQIRVGDSVVFAFGMMCPFIVRPCDPEYPERHEYTLMGCAQVSELMNHDEEEKLNQAVDDGLLETIDINLR